MAKKISAPTFKEVWIVLSSLERAVSSEGHYHPDVRKNIKARWVTLRSDMDYEQWKEMFPWKGHVEDCAKTLSVNKVLGSSLKPAFRIFVA